MPSLGFIEAADTMEEIMKRVNKALVKKENDDYKILQRLQKENPGKCIIHEGDNWYIS